MLWRQRDEYLRAGLSTGLSGLIDGAFVLRDHGSRSALALSCTWYQQLLRYPPRDQPGAAYALWRRGFTPTASHDQLAARRRDWRHWAQRRNGSAAKAATAANHGVQLAWTHAAKHEQVAAIPPCIL